MRLVLIYLFIFSTLGVFAQEAPLSINSNSIFRYLKSGDSLTVYQCHVEEASQNVTTKSGQTFTSTGTKCTITEKYVIHRSGDNYSMRYYTTSLTLFPNRKFSGLKVKERPYWQFAAQKSRDLSHDELKIFLAFENKGREAIEFDYGISRYNTNQVIFKYKKDFKQLVISTDHVISHLIPL